MELMGECNMMYTNPTLSTVIIWSGGHEGIEAIKMSGFWHAVCLASTINLDFK
jgi:hypothetical protein